MVCTKNSKGGRQIPTDGNFFRLKCLQLVRCMMVFSNTMIIPLPLPVVMIGLAFSMYVSHRGTEFLLRFEQNPGGVFKSAQACYTPDVLVNTNVVLSTDLKLTRVNRFTQYATTVDTVVFDPNGTFFPT